MADSRCLLPKLFLPFDDAVPSGNRGQPRGFHFPPRTVLLSHHFDHFGGRANESDLRSLAYLGKGGVLGKKAIAGGNGVHIRVFRATDYLRNIQVTLPARRRANSKLFIGKWYLQGVP